MTETALFMSPASSSAARCMSTGSCEQDHVGLPWLCLGHGLTHTLLSGGWGESLTPASEKMNPPDVVVETAETQGSSVESGEALSK